MGCLLLISGVQSYLKIEINYDISRCNKKIDTPGYHLSKNSLCLRKAVKCECTT